MRGEVLSRFDLARFDVTQVKLAYLIKLASVARTPTRATASERHGEPVRRYCIEFLRCGLGFPSHDKLTP